jgi:DNA (cytosine-5)-methyltransferase 1
MTTPVTFGSLFSGAGGFDIGLERAQMQCKFQVEWDSHCQQVLQHHWSDVPKWTDVQQVNGAELPPVEVIAWGSPCQDLSHAGNRTGLDGEKSSMFFEGIRIIKEMREATNGTYPTVSIWENVAGAIISNKGDDFQTILRELAEAGCHHIEWRMLDSQWFRIPQRRRRIFVVAVWHSSAVDTGGQQILVERDNSQTHSELSATPAHNDAKTWEQRQSRSCASSGTSTDESHEQQPLIIDGARIGDIRAYAGGIGQTLSATMMNKTNIPIVIVDGTARHLTEIECERMMGWADDHTRFRADGKETPSTQRYKMCGNGVAAPVATWIGERIVGLLRSGHRSETLAP